MVSELGNLLSWCVCVFELVMACLCYRFKRHSCVRFNLVMACFSGLKGTPSFFLKVYFTVYFTSFLFVGREIFL